MLKYLNAEQADGHCLADLCPIFGCQAMFKDEKADTMRAKFDNTVSCLEDDAEAFRFRCESIAKKCFVPNSKIDNVFRSQICNAIRCERGLLQVRFPSVGTMQSPCVFSCNLLISACACVCSVCSSQGPRLSVNQLNTSDFISTAFYNGFAIIAVLGTVCAAGWYVWKWRSRPGHTLLRTQAQRMSAFDRVVDFVSSLVGTSKGSKKRR
jgi:hypothetical protein